ncbi:type II toxin-antitoxin system death-on-curing family toxin [Phosphitispora fastidiosa]|uniref:type II toxin-antitoxin system death-on-curing family toxin n=1 Tax=Phosphitispora fastidiosa TaxID=2837202 RepID=UPI00338F3D2C|nr:death-on-curing protein [Phosphitispora fastidiosa]
MIHEESIILFGGEPGYYDYTDGRIESILSLQYPIFAHDKYPNIFQKAAMLLFFFTKDHCFIDGNKRVGIQSTIVFLTINGLIDNLDDDDGYLKSMEVASSRVSEVNRDAYIQ